MTSSSSRLQRKNVTKACLECRRRKAKLAAVAYDSQCDGKTPSYSRCADRLYHCQYAEAEDGRRPASRCYVTRLRDRILILERVLRHHSIDIETSISQLETTTIPAMPQRCPTDDESCSKSPTWSTDDLLSATQGVLSVDHKVSLDMYGEAHYFGPTSGRLEFRNLQTEDDYGGTDSHAFQRPEAVEFGIHSTRNSYNHLVNSIEEDGSISEELKYHLIDLYFTWEQPWFQVVDERLFRQAEKTDGRYCSPLLLNSIMALGSRYSDRIDVLTDTNDPSTAGGFFLEKAEILLHYHLKWPDITTIQALAILSIVYIAHGNDSLGLLHQHMAKGMAIDMGFNLDPAALADSLALPPDEIELRRQIYWSLYCHNKLAGACVGRTCTMLSCQGAVRLPSLAVWSEPSATTDNERSVATKANKLGLQLGLIKICQILERILVNLRYAPTPTLTTGQQRGFLSPRFLDLENWSYDLPSTMRANQIDRGVWAPQTYLLHMVFQTAQILLMKPFTSPKYMGLSTQAAASNAETAERICHRAAVDLCVTGKKYQQHIGTFRRSPITATHCVLYAALVLLRQQDESEITATKDGSTAISTCLLILQELSRPASCLAIKTYIQSPRLLNLNMPSCRLSSRRANSCIISSLPAPAFSIAFKIVPQLDMLHLPEIAHH
ncbi:hypothetical protein E4T42_07884 [Aureobasidium subglaciale]|nr:hypothetical protein E4T42_07884 [Aureobasidium subglaciale]